MEAAKTGGRLAQRMPRRRREQRSDFGLLSIGEKRSKKPMSDCWNAVSRRAPRRRLFRCFSRVVRQNEVHLSWCGKWTTADFEYDCPCGGPSMPRRCRRCAAKREAHRRHLRSMYILGAFAATAEEEDASAVLTAPQSAGKRPCCAASAHRPKAGLRLLSCPATPPQSPTAVHRSSCAGAVPGRVTSADVQIIRYAFEIASERGRTRVWENVGFRPSSHECRRQRRGGLLQRRDYQWRRLPRCKLFGWERPWAAHGRFSVNCAAPNSAEDGRMNSTNRVLPHHHHVGCGRHAVVSK